MSIVIIGDTHGDINFLINLIKKCPKKTNFIQVGDFGIGFPRMNFEESLIHIEDNLKLQDSIMYVCRGNHDDPAFFDGTYMDTNLKLVPDYSVIKIEKKQILFIGGGISLDRTMRTPNVSWWSKEKVEFKESELDKLEKVDYVITHTAPDFCVPKKLNDFCFSWIKHDWSLEKELPQERQIMTEIYNYLTKTKQFKIQKWFYGHFHMNTMMQVHEGTQFKQLGINEIVKLNVKANKKPGAKSKGEELGTNTLDV